LELADHVLIPRQDSRIRVAHGPHCDGVWNAGREEQRRGAMPQPVERDSTQPVRRRPVSPRSGERRWLPRLADAVVHDELGDLVGWSDTNGALQGTALYDPWGELLSGTGDMATVPTNGAFRFQSDLADSATGQVDMLTRYYQPTLGRFSSRDVLFGDPTAPSTLNQSVYGVVNPITYSDPTGMGACTMANECATLSHDGRRVTRGGNPGDADYDTSVHGTPASEVYRPLPPLVKTIELFEAMTPAQRINWLDDFSSYYHLDGWLNSIRGVLRASDDAGLLKRGSWSSLVDAAILHAIQEGMQLRLNQIDSSSNPGAAKWEVFFKARTDGRVPDWDLITLWAGAESEATNYGYSLASKRGLSATYGELGLARGGDAYRLLMRNGLNMFFDPRNEVQTFVGAQVAYSVATSSGLVNNSIIAPPSPLQVLL
jgi:RHS repeat-associated protein